MPKAKAPARSMKQQSDVSATLWLPSSVIITVTGMECLNGDSHVRDKRIQEIQQEWKYTSSR